jgi:hypothetical protein
MPKKPPKQVEIPKVVPLTEEKRQVIATNQKSQRVIVGIGQQRISSRVLPALRRAPEISPRPWSRSRKNGNEQQEP